MKYQIAACCVLMFCQADADRDELEDRLETLFAEGDVALEAAEYDAALSTYTEALGINEAIVELDAEDIRTRVNLCSVLQRIAEVHRRQGQYDAAELYCNRRIHSLQSFSSLHPDATLIDSNLANALDQLGNLFTEAGESERATEYFERSHAICKTLAESDPSNVEFQRDLAYSLEIIGQHHNQLLDRDQALHFLMQAYEIEQQLLSLDPDNLYRRNRYSLLLGNIAEANLFSSRFDEASQYWSEAVDFAKATLRMEPGSDEWRLRLAIATGGLGSAQLSLLNYAEAIALLEQKIEMIEREEFTGQLAESAHDSLEHARSTLATARRWQLADGPWDDLVAQPVDSLITLLHSRCGLKSRDGDIDEIVRSAEKLEELAPLEPQREADALRYAAAGYAICAKLAAGWRPPGPYPAPDAAEPTRAQLELQQSFISRSMTALQASIDKGLTDYEWLHEEPYFDALRGLPEFEALFEPDVE